MSAIGLLPGEGKWLIRSGWGENSLNFLLGEGMAHRVHFTSLALAGLLACRPNECKFHLQEDQMEGGDS